ncbi:forkhead box protein N3 isoform X2 [Parasteatoda tepidariorum]|uniref:forkhead box protein N3 isoform X2 n=1 Tax=Parasteatoda tepidariorum TaxID=114398 RepID=UPI00077FB90A|nr:forkhead box protein N3 isoform X2 [Parasteatoda tepidariorum]
MAVEEHAEEDKSILAMTTNFKHTPNGLLSIGKSSNPNSLFVTNLVKETTGEDDELTSLAWLQDTNLLKNFQVGNYGIESEDVLSDSPSSDYLDETIEHVTVNGSESSEQNVSEAISGHAPYNPTLHANSKPPFSFSCLIFMAIEESANKALPVKDIYNWILTRFPYFQNAPTGWKNSVRHNLSLSKCFRKVEKEKGQNVGKGSLWCIDPEFRPNLVQALQKAPSMANVEFSQFACVSANSNGKIDSEIKPCLLVSSQEAIQIPSPDPEVDAAATMLTLKNSPSVITQSISEESENDSIQSNQKFVRKRLRLKHVSQTPAAKKIKVTKPVITSSPSEDHTYSACLNDPKCSLSITSELDDELPRWPGEKNNNDGKVTFNGKCTSKVTLLSRKNEAEEGAHALMNLAEIASKRLLRKSHGKHS